ncbi:hypothetical protein [Myxococcus stipitatus]|uniref:hypothetical protein n=1 Tax=Myxococcus stipitatus TaxID=83455 RepID=UPI0030CE4EAD
MTRLAVGWTEGNIVPANNPVHFHFHTPLAPQTVRPRVETWSPGVDDIRRFERGLAAHLRTSLGPHLQHVRTPSEDTILRDYRRQYVGLIVEGRKLLHVEIYSPWLANHVPDWRSSEFDMDDVGMDWLWFDVEVTQDELIQVGYSGDP